MVTEAILLDNIQYLKMQEFSCFSLNYWVPVKAQSYSMCTSPCYLDENLVYINNFSITKDLLAKKDCIETDDFTYLLYRIALTSIKKPLRIASERLY